MSILEVKDLKKYFPVTRGIFKKEERFIKAVDNVSFKVGAGEIVGIVGESGSGKSTLAKTAIALQKPTAGDIFFMDKPINYKSHALRTLRKEVQMVFQDPYSSLNPRKTIYTSLTEALYYHGIIREKEKLIKKALEILDLVGLPKDSLERYPHEFSGGQQQRICIGRAIALKPKLIVCDEAVSALDVSVQAQILNLLYWLKQEFDLSYLFISHDLNVIRHFCDTILVMFNGKVVEEAKTKELFDHPKNEYTKTLFASCL
jgi:ABC-type oligopeptide transport system ATPase subunit